MEDDGLPTRDSGEWVKRKHHYLDRYCDIVNHGMKNKWRRLVYLDLLTIYLKMSERFADA